MHKLTKTRFVHNKTSISQSPKKPGKFRKKTLPPKFNTRTISYPPIRHIPKQAK